MPRERKPSVGLSFLTTKVLAHRLYRLCMVADTCRSHAIRDAIDRMIAGSEFPPIVRSKRGSAEPNDSKVSLYIFASQRHTLERLAAEHGALVSDVLRSAAELACDRMERRMAGEPIGA